jgi:hypothetical protein
MTRAEWIELWERLKRIESVNRKVWKAKHYRWANSINWEVQRIKDKVQEQIGQLE